jgi:hypothetical protein
MDVKAAFVPLPLTTEALLAGACMAFLLFAAIWTSLFTGNFPILIG